MALGLQYFMEFDPECRLNIFSEGFAGTVTELIGSGDNPVEYDSPDVDNPYVALRGGSLTVRFLATLDTPEDTLYAEDEKYFYAEFTIGGLLQFKGYVIPDGVLQSFVLNEWETSFQVIDGLSMLENYEYSQDVGLAVEGKYLLKDIICACLNPLTFPSDSVYIAADIYYQGAPDIADTFDWIRVSNERYLQADKATPMDCKEVLQSILEPFALMIVQHLGHWYVFSQGGYMLQGDDSITFFRYVVNNGAFSETVIINPQKILAPEWSETKDFYHINANQELSTERAVKITRIRYEIGIKESTLANPTFLVGVGPEPDNWTVEADGIDFTFLDPGLSIRHIDGSGRNPIIKSDPVAVDAANGGFTLTIFASGSSTDSNPFYVTSSIQVGGNYWDASAGVWVGSYVQNRVAMENETSRTITITTTAAPASGDLQIGFYDPIPVTGIFDPDVFVIISKAEAFQSLADTGLKAWVYVRENEGNILKIPDAVTVFNGDGNGGLLGDLYENDGVTPTAGFNFENNWFGAPILVNPLFPPLAELLNITVLRVGYSKRRRQYIYEGDVSGIFPYLSAVTIEGLPEKFFVTGMRINYAKGISELKMNQLISGTISSEVLFGTTSKEPEYENTIKPVING